MSQPWRMLWALCCGPFACTALPSGDVAPTPTADAATPGDASVDAAATEDGSQPCASAGPPPRPDVQDGPDSGELAFVSRWVSEGAKRQADGEPLFRRLGHDLDGVCTDRDGRASCMPPAWGAVVTDAPGGRDVTLNELFLQTEALFPSTASDLVRQSLGEAELGEAAFLLRVRGYNGAPNDPSIEVAAYAVTMWDGATRPRPRWDGEDRWRPTTPWLEVGDDGELDAGRPRYVTEEAYVADGRLVAHFDRVTVGSPFYTAGTLHRASISARLARVGDGFELLDGAIAGRWSVSNCLYFFALEISLPEGTVACRDAEFIQVVKDLVCGNADVNLAADDPAETCDGLSMMYAFESKQARLGEALHVELAEPTCVIEGCDGAPISSLGED